MSAAQGAEAAWTEHRPTRHHIAYLGGILQEDVRHAERRVEFWAKTKAFRLAEATPVVQAAAPRPWGRIPFAWPRDGRRETLEGAGIAFANQYKAQGLEMLYEHAQFEDGSVPVEAGLMEMLSRKETGRFKVFGDLNDWFEEFRLYHRKDGRVVKERGRFNERNAICGHVPALGADCGLL
jgi:hypothetical protein